MSSMNDQERVLLQDFLQQLLRIRGIDKDTEADVMIAKAFAQQPDAPYLVVQRALLLEQALNAAKAEIAELRNQQVRGGSGQGFLSGANAWGRGPEQVPQRAALSVSGRPIPADPAGAPAAPAPAPMPRSPMGSFLGQAAATAAGVAGGAFLFQGLESLLGGRHDPSGFAEHAAQDNPLRDADVTPQDDAGLEDISSDFGDNDFDDADDSSSI